MQKIWKIEKRKLSDLKVLKGNPRKISDINREQLKQDLELGKFKPFIIDAKNTILAGNQTYKVMLELIENPVRKDRNGDEVPVKIDYDMSTKFDCSVPQFKLSASERKKIVILDNKHRGEDDLDKLMSDYANQLEDLEYGSLLPEKLDYDEMMEGMPEFNNENKEAVKSLIVNFDSEKDLEEFAKLIDQKITFKTRSVWFPENKPVKANVYD